MKIALIVLSLIVAAETSYLVLMKKEKDSVIFFKKDSEKDLLLSNLKKKGVPVHRLSLEPHLKKWYQVEIENISRPFFVTPDARFFLVGEVLDSLAPKKNETPNNKIENRLLLTPQSIMTKKEMLQKLEKQIETLTTYRRHLLGEK